MERAVDSNLCLSRRACLVVLFAGVLCVGVGQSVEAQGAGTEAQRIAQLRDQAAAQATPAPTQAIGDDAPAAGEQTGEPNDNEPAKAQKPLPANEALPLGAGESSLFNIDGATTQTPSKLGDGWLLSTLAALGVVLALVFGLRWLLKRGGVAAIGGMQGSVVEVLSRTMVAPRSHVVLLRVGNRILIVNDSPNGMRTLASVEDPEEVAGLLASIDAAKPNSMTRSFSGVMGRLSSAWSDADTREVQVQEADAIDDGVTIDQTRGAVSSVRSRLAVLSGGGIKA